jgi:glutamate racemase
MQPGAAMRPIGVFDSGVGGLTVLKALLSRLPGEQYLYLGDTARLPYGAKSAQSVTRYALQTTRFLVDQGVKLLVVACNTASAVALDALSAAYPGLPVVGVVRPGARAGCGLARTRRLAVIATESTVQGGAYQAAIRELCPDMAIKARACPLLVALAEEGWVDGPLVEAVVARYLEPLFAEFAPGRPDALVLGCTHFPLLEAPIRAVAGPGVAIIDSAATAAAEVEERLAALGLRRQGPDPAPARFYATDGAARFARVGGLFLGQPLDPDQITIVDL